MGQSLHDNVGILNAVLATEKQAATQGKYKVHGAVKRDN